MTTKHNASKQPVRIEALIIGTGFSGLGAGIALEKEGIDFLILEKADDVGGTWRDNTYPGCQCDIPSSVYQYSFAQKKNWSQMWAPQAEILEYLREVASDYKLHRFIHFGKAVCEAWWDDEAMRWHVMTADGSEYISKFLISGTGALHIPHIPEFKGLDNFEGSAFHSAKWDHSVDLTNKRVAVIGTGASAIQIVPSIIDKVAELKLFQRTPAWVMPWTNVDFPRWAEWSLSHVPGLHSVWRESLFWWHEFIGYGMTKRPGILKIAEMLGKWNINRNIADPDLRRKLTPNYSVGCKRILKDGDYYKALGSAKSDVVTDNISYITEEGIVTDDGTLHQVDVIVFATGFHVTDSYKYLQLRGRNGEDLVARADRNGVIAHRGVMFADVPNLFLMMGPNSGLGHNSMVEIIEAQIRYVVQAINEVDLRGMRAIVPTWNAQNTYNDGVQEELDRTVWNTGCSSWYFDEHGKNRVLWKGLVYQYRRSMKKLDTSEFQFLP